MNGMNEMASHLLLDWQHAHASHFECDSILAGHQLDELLVDRILQSIAVDAQDLVANLWVGHGVRESHVEVR